MRLGFRTLLIAAIISVSSVTAGAEELASGHYFPGALSSFIDLLPLNTGSSTIGISNDSIYYHGSSNHANGTVYANSWALLYQFPDADLDFAGSASILSCAWSSLHLAQG